MSIHEKSKLIPPESKLGILKLLIEETRKYELLTTNQYLPQIELVVGILEELSKWSSARTPNSLDVAIFLNADTQEQ